MAFDVTTTDGTIERIDDADAYQLEGPLTTFFQADGGHGKLSGWSVRVASLRTDHIVAVRRVRDDLTCAVGAHDGRADGASSLRAV